MTTALTMTADPVVENERLRIIYYDIINSINEAIRRHRVTYDEFGHALNFVSSLGEAGQLPLHAFVTFAFALADANEGVGLANPDKDGATVWYPEGPAYVAGAPFRERPYVLAANSEPGTPLFVSSTVKSTSGEPLSGAVIDLWMTNDNGNYSSMTPEMLGPIDASIIRDIPPFHLRGQLVADEDGRIEYQTILPGVEILPLEVGSPLHQLLTKIGCFHGRPRHIHAHVSSPGYLALTHQAHFTGDPYLEHVFEGSVDTRTVFPLTEHNDPAEMEARGVNRPFLTVEIPYILRPAA